MWKKGIERLEKQILQYINIYIYRDQINIVLVKKCKTTDIPAVNSAIGNIQKVLQKYVGFSRMDLEYCDRIRENLWIELRPGARILKNFITRLKFIQSTPLRVMLQMFEYFLTILR